MNNWQKDLKEMKLRHIEKTAPEFFKLSGGYKMKVNPYTDKTANGLTKCIVDYITFNGGFAKKDAGCIHANISGLSVIISIWNDKLSSRQKDNIKAAGGLYYVAKDMESFLTWYNNLAESLKNTNNTFTINLNNN